MAGDVWLSKRLAYMLRHDPDSVGLSLDPAGWVDVDLLLAALRRGGAPVTLARLQALVRDSDKQRFAFDDSGRRIRASQGHSVAVDLGLDEVEPPDRLFHGTARRNLPSILAGGLHRAGRHAVHLSPDVPTALRVGARRGPAVVLEVDSARMHADGFRFSLSANGVWLVQHVPSGYLEEAPAAPPA